MTKTQEGIAFLIGAVCTARGAFAFLPDWIAYTDVGDPSLPGIVISLAVTAGTFRAIQVAMNEGDEKRRREHERAETNRITNRID